MAVQQIIGGTLIAGGTLLGELGARQQRAHSRGALNQRSEDVQRIQGQQEQAAGMLGDRTRMLQAQRAGLLNDLVNFYGGQTQAIQGGEQQSQEMVGQDVSQGLGQVQGDVLGQVMSGGQGQQIAQRAQDPRIGLLQQLMARQFALNQQVQARQAEARRQTLGTMGIQRDLSDVQGEHRVQQAGFSLEDALSQMNLQRGLQAAQREGGAERAIGGLMQGIGGSLLGGGFGR